MNEFRVEEDGVDSGYIFKDFLENITKTTFDTQCGLFKETTNHLLHPHPASPTILDFIWYSICHIFPRKLKEKHNYLHNFLTLDPEMYWNLLSLNHYDGDVSQLGLYFVCENSEYAKQKEEEMLAGGKG